MKLGVTPWNFADRTARGLTEQARAAEALGYDSFWLPENHFNAGAIPDPLMLLAAVAAGTETIRLATTSYLLPLRNPLQAAEQVAVLDQLSHGRVILGIGRGYAPVMLKAFNVVPSEKRKLFEWSLQRMRDAWSGQPVLLDDEETTVVLDPLPVQRPHPPLWVAAFGPKALAQAGRLGLPYLASPVETLDTLEANFQRHENAASAEGHPPQETVPIMRTIFLSANARQVGEVRERIGVEAMKSGRLAQDAAVDDWSIVGDECFVRDRITEYRERLGVNHLIVTRLRIGSMDDAEVQASVARVAEVVGGLS
ncbi:MAG: LLM class flavin-dependent oxidoreductase [Gammaproteobacteria bacterium]|nr:LLM class flavin-dependent oxidoreductase [Gammaproteobacteria bacterium]